jgi:hypothetical protein
VYRQDVDLDYRSAMTEGACILVVLEGMFWGDRPMRLWISKAIIGTSLNVY